MRTAYKVKRGMVFWYCNEDISDKRTSVQKYRRPYIVVSCDEGNISSPTCNIIPCTTEDKVKIPTHVDLFFNDNSNIALCEQITTVDQNVLNQRDTSFICFLTDGDMSRIEDALAIQFNISPKIQYEGISIGNISETLETMVENLIRTKVQEQTQNINKASLEDSALRLGQLIEDLVGASHVPVSSKPALKTIEAVNNELKEEPKEEVKVERKPVIKEPKQNSKREYNKWTKESRMNFLKDCDILETEEVMEKYKIGTLKSLSATKYNCKVALGIK